ncbi:hypothetical protein MM300_15155 [Evansella sp. LMS18]|jgi:gas vesicle protein|uniref:hypothetical protein n=1 Tax=Evansella sp. LMS18 TaxID=2924033 RepID=UPI0020D06085|nr:hypothetical protein [Evansella sp. LMS18]UTR09232.1 hypothetical protein MM300_15155 [Evansella sp. LMS18]
MINKTYIAGIITGSVLAGGALLFSTTDTGRGAYGKYDQAKETLLTTWKELQIEIEEFLITVNELKDKAVTIIKEYVPSLKNRLEQLKEEFKPLAEEVKELVSEIEELLHTLTNELKNVKE